jgi:hypothetical protein
MFRSLIVGLFVIGMSAGCANMQPVLSGGRYCLEGTELNCASREGDGDCQPCPRSATAPLAAAATPAMPAVIPVRPE